VQALVSPISTICPSSNSTNSGPAAAAVQAQRKEGVALLLGEDGAHASAGTAQRMDPDLGALLLQGGEVGKTLDMVPVSMASEQVDLFHPRSTTAWPAASMRITCSPARTSTQRVFPS